MRLRQSFAMLSFDFLDSSCIDTIVCIVCCIIKVRHCISDGKALAFFIELVLAQMVLLVALVDIVVEVDGFQSQTVVDCFQILAFGWN